MKAVDLVSRLIREPQAAAGLGLKDWDLLIRQAREGVLLARVHHLLSTNELLDHVPEPVLRHMESASAVARRHTQVIRWEVALIQKALLQLGIPVVLLKGAAYVMADLPAAVGRVFVDVDILVPKPALADAEKALNRHGWMSAHHDEYDQRYYRTWMHELPPMVHMKRQTVLDVHHTILPETARLHPDPYKLIVDSVPVDDMDEIYVLAPVDMVLHSATHLFSDGELEHGLRDLVDLDALIRHFGQEQDFWGKLVDRAREMELSRPLYYALRYTTRILGTPVPAGVLSDSRVGTPNAVQSKFMDQLFLRALRPAHPSCEDSLTGTARWLLYVRSHYLRMPFRLLLPHLFHKAFITPYKEKAAEKKAEARPGLDDFLDQAK